MKDVWIVRGKSESGDKYGPKRYDHAPSKTELREFIQQETPEELDCDGPGDFDSYVYLDVEKL